jgi:prepilin-type N-terminal cleavage/methylation domain-containing protein
MRKGFSLIEITIVIAIVMILVAIVTSALKPIALVNRARDAQRKKDLDRIKIAFEEYNNDMGSYPGKDMVNLLRYKGSCSSNVFKPWLSSWPCDPNGETYYILIPLNPDGTLTDKPGWYKVLTNLEDKQDKDIPAGWYVPGAVQYVGPYTHDQVNYGVSSQNVSWRD